MILSPSLSRYFAVTIFEFNWFRNLTFYFSFFWEEHFIWKPCLVSPVHQNLLDYSYIIASLSPGLTHWCHTLILFRQVVWRAITRFHIYLSGNGVCFSTSMLITRLCHFHIENWCHVLILFRQVVWRAITRFHHLPILVC